MKYLIFLIFTLSFGVSTAQTDNTKRTESSRSLLIEKTPEKGFYWDYILYIPEGTPLNKSTFLLVEPNNTGKVSDSLEVHKKSAMELATKSGVGNNVSRELNIPLLVPVFPRPAAKPLVYTHALDRDIILEQSPELKRLDLQLLAMINDARSVLSTMQIQLEPKFFMTGFSASATFVNRFSFLHPEKIKALAIGGFNGKLMIPQDSLNGFELDYPIGTNDYNALFNENFDLEVFRKIPQFIYMGEMDENDAVQFDDAYNENERKIINTNLGDRVYKRYLKCQELYSSNGIFPVFKSYAEVGHWTTSQMNLEVILFLLGQTQVE